MASSTDLAQPLGPSAIVAFVSRHSGETMDSNERLYRAIIWIRGSDRPGQRVSVIARDLDEAKKKLESEYGEGNVFDLHNEEDAAAPRSALGV
jgi:hypothetical protein